MIPILIESTASVKGFSLFFLELFHGCRDLLAFVFSQMILLLWVRSLASNSGQQNHQNAPDTSHDLSQQPHQVLLWILQVNNPSVTIPLVSDYLPIRTVGVVDPAHG